MGVAVSGSPDDWGKWLALAGAAAAVGILPKHWQKGLALAGVALWLWKHR